MSENQAHVAVVGAGIGGLTLAYRLAQRGFKVSLYERSDSYGGLAASLDYHGVSMDRYYHTILSSDLSMQRLIEETGVGELLHFTPTKQGFYDGGKLYPFNSARDLLTFPPLNLFQRFRLGLQVITAQFENDVERLDREPVEQWLVRVSGRGVYEKVWKPLLRAKFDTAMADVPATYIWSRLKRMLSTRKGVTSKEMMCYLEGGYFTLLKALADRVSQLGVTIHLATAVEEVLIRDGRAIGLRIEGEEVPFDGVISTLPSSVLADLIPQAPADLRARLEPQGYLAVICPLLILRKRLTPYYVLNITDGTVPFTAVVETTNLIDPKYVGDYHLVYLPKYVTVDSSWWTKDPAEIQLEWTGHFRRMFPNFDESLIVDFIMQRARFVEPLRPLGTSLPIPSIETEVAGLFMSNSAMVYPELNNGESITRLAERVVNVVAAQLSPASATPDHVSVVAH
ncbi:MAG: NAD(P)/FAD-dependent oxidoreductase [Anaerolineae bacterium]